MIKKLLSNNSNKTKLLKLVIIFSIFEFITTSAMAYQNDARYEITIPIRVENLSTIKVSNESALDFWCKSIHTFKKGLGIKSSYCSPKTKNYSKKNNTINISCMAYDALLKKISDINANISRALYTQSSNINYPFGHSKVTITGNTALTHVVVSLTIPYKNIKKYPYYFCVFSDFAGTYGDRGFGSDRPNIQESLSRLLVSGKLPTK